MAVTRQSRVISLTEVNDAVAGKLKLAGISLVGTGMTEGQRLTITETDGAVLADHYIDAANENVELLPQEQWVDGIILSAVPAAGTWTVYVRYL